MAYQEKVFMNRKENIEQIKTKISLSQYQFISFDIFDTLLVRNFWEPGDLFVLLDDYYCSLGHKVSSKRFSAIRVHAEEQVRNILSKCNPSYQDITFDEIYDYIERTNRLSCEDILKIKEYELDLEFMYCRARESIKELYNYAIELGKKIICISDMYLPREVIERLLKHNGYNFFDKIFISSEIRLTKYTGSLFIYALRKLGVEPSQVLHIGDNLEVDKINAEKAGIQAIYYPKVKDAFIHTLEGVEKQVYARELRLWCRAVPASRFMYARSILSNVANEYFDDPFFRFKTKNDFYQQISKTCKLINESYSCPSGQIRFWGMIYKANLLAGKLVKYGKFALSNRKLLITKIKHLLN